MTHSKTISITACCTAIALIASTAAADVGGVWKTESNDEGRYLHVTIAPCASDASKTCGTISRAFTSQGEDTGYANLGRSIIEDMTSSDGVEFDDGTIWNPSDGDTYSSEMRLKGDILEVDGCVAFICKEQTWTRVR
ncbi:MAG: DUF2147 domain-containing protein [Pseudomonadota bacterium]